MAQNISAASYNQNFTGRELQVEIITVIITSSLMLGSLPFNGPAFDTARLDIQQLYPRLKFTQKFVLSGSQFRTCADWATESDNALASFYYQKGRNAVRNPDLTVFVMPGCEDANGVARFAAQLDKLIISSVSTAVTFRNKALWPTWITTTINSSSTLKQFCLSLVDLYHWINLIILSDISSNSWFPALATMFYNVFSASSKIQVNAINFNATSDVNYDGILRNVSSLSRVVFYFGHSTPLRKIMKVAKLLNMTNDEYVYVAVIPFRHSSFGNYTWQSKENSTEEETKEAFRSLLIIEPDQSEERQNNDLEKDWKRRSADAYNYSYASDETVSPHPMSTYVAMLALAEVLEELRQIGSINLFNSGTEMAKRFMNRTFSPKTGQIRINEFGERIPTMTLTQTDVDTGSITTILTQNSESGKIRITGNISWPGSWPVPSQPQCGFRGDATICQKQSEKFTAVHAAILGVAAIIIILGTAAFVRIRLLQRNGAAENPWWILSAENLDQNATHLSTKSVRNSG